MAHGSLTSKMGNIILLCDLRAESSKYLENTMHDSVFSYIQFIFWGHLSNPNHFWKIAVFYSISTYIYPQICICGLPECATAAEFIYF